MNRPLLILRMGQTAAEVRAVRGNYERYFIEALDGLEAPVVVKDAVAGELPRAHDYGAIIVTGSPASVPDREPWSEAAGAWLRGVVEEVPTLGVCYGHQLIAHAMGGAVERHPAGPELGVYPIHVSEDDPLFDGLPRVFPAFEVHWDHVSVIPDGARPLAHSAGSLQALAVGARSRTVQFHPEYDAELTRWSVIRHGKALDPAQPEWVQKQHAAVTELPDQRRLIWNFIRHFTDLR